MSRVRRMYIPAKGRAEMIEGTIAEQVTKVIQIMNEFKGV
jgi:electron transfer flavoprotein beta subunit